MKRERLVLCCVPHACDARQTLYIIAFISIAGVLRDVAKSGAKYCVYDTHELCHAQR